MLGKQVIAIAPSIYQEAGFRDAVAMPQQLASLRLNAELDAAEQAKRRESIPRQTLRFAYAMVHRVPQYTRFVRAEATTRFKYDMSADPQRFIELLRSGELRADDDEFATDAQAEDQVLKQIARRDWQGLIDAVEPDTRTYEPVRRRPLFRYIDNVRKWSPIGDR